MVSRRDFLKLAAVGTCGSAIHNVLSPFGGMMAFADGETSALSNGKVMVVINLAGGASYNIAPPFNSAYQAKMSNIFPSNPLTLNSEQGLHPALASLKQVYDEGHMALVNLAGHANENRSHAESTDIRMSAVVNGSMSNQSGWAARLSCAMGGFLTLVSLGGSNLFIEGSCNPGKSLSNLNSFGEDNFWWGGQYGAQWLRDVRDSAITKANAPQNTNAIFVQGAMVNLQGLLEQIEANTNFNLPVAMPSSSIGQQLRDIAKLIAAPGLGARVLFAEQGGYDTHANEVNSLNNNLSQLNAAIAGFIDNMKALELWDNVILITLSEFSRTFQNGTDGTDHGHAAPMFIAGGQINGGVKTPAPTAAQTVGQYYDDSKIHVDFRRVFYEAISKMGSYDMNVIFPEPFTNTVYNSIGI